MKIIAKDDPSDRRVFMLRQDIDDGASLYFNRAGETSPAVWASKRGPAGAIAYSPWDMREWELVEFELHEVKA